MFFSENYIFGKFDTFCKRLERIADMMNTIENFSGLGEVKIEGLDIIVVKYKTIVDNAKKKTYDILDHRKAEVSRGRCWKRTSVYKILAFIRGEGSLYSYFVFGLAFVS